MRYNRVDFQDTMRVAQLMAQKAGGRLRFIFATANGWIISTKRVRFQDCYWTNGRKGGKLDAYATTYAE